MSDKLTETIIFRTTDEQRRFLDKKADSYDSISEYLRCVVDKLIVIEQKNEQTAKTNT